jgi:ATP-dependent Clp protease ATP-binding subunit ClpC
VEGYQRFTVRAKQAVIRARELAEQVGSDSVDTEHLLYAITVDESGYAAKALQLLRVDVRRIAEETRRHFQTGSGSGKEPELEEGAKRVLRYAVNEANRMNSRDVGTEHILLGLIQEGQGGAAQILHRFRLRAQEIRQAVMEVVGQGTHPSRTFPKEKSRTPAIDHFGRDLNKEAEEGELDPVIGRDEEIERVIQVLSRRTKNNACLIGEAGVGKTAIAQGLAQRILEGRVPEPLRNKRIVCLDMAAIVAGTKYRGEFEERMKKILEEIVASKGDFIVFLDELHTLVGAGAAEGALDASNILKPALARGQVRCIGATTLDEYRKYIEKSPSLERRFQAILVNESTVDEAIEILKGVAPRYEEHHHVSYTPDALVLAVKLSHRYITDRHLPDKAIDVMDEAGSRVRLRTLSTPPELKEVEKRIEEVKKQKDEAVANANYELATELRDRQHEIEEESLRLRAEWEAKADEIRPVVDAEEIAYIVSKWTGVPTTALTEEQSARLLRMEDRLHETIVGQVEAVKAVSHAIRRSRAGLKDPKRAAGCFIFLGPTGVGKTLMARALAQFLFDDQEAIIRVDMSEYMERFNVSRLMGAPPGYVGYEEGGQLTEAVRRRPYCVVLLDEIEKAHPDVFNILLQVMEDGRLTDSLGRVVSFRECVLIMTSNVGARNIDSGRPIGFGTDAQGGAPFDEEAEYARMKAKVMDELKKTFRPEFLNRVDDVIVFRALTPAEIRQIVDLELAKVVDRLALQGMTLEVSPGVKELLATEGYDRKLGARPLSRAVQRIIEDPLSEEILVMRFGPGDHIVVKLKGRTVSFEASEQLAV